jgi:SP family myo-inositol transporter-like MFS transporter 13
MSAEGLSIEEAFSLFEDGFGVRKSEQMRREKKEISNRQDIEEGTRSPTASQLDENEKNLPSVHVERA